MKAICLFTMILSILIAGGAFAQTPKELKPSAPKAATATSGGPALSLSEFLGQVSSKHQGYQAADQTSKAAMAESEAAKLLFRPNLVGEARAFQHGLTNPYADDTSKVTNRAYNLGVEQQTNFGLSGKLLFNHNEYINPATQVGPSSQWKPDWFSLEFSQSLYRNWNGREAKSQAELIQSGALAKAFSQSYATKQLLLEAESNYWSLVLARENVAMQKDSVARAQRIHDWTSRRVRLQLADRAEGLQASTNLQSRKLDLKTAEDQERVAAQMFNSSRGVVGDQVNETLATLTPELIASFNVPARTTQRDDVKAAEFQAKSTAANARLEGEKNKPKVELYGSLPVTKPQEPPGGSGNFMFLSQQPGTTIGLRLSMPLDIGTQSRVREGYAAEAQAADWTFQRKSFEEERDWQDLTSKFREAKERLKLYTELEKQQSEKLNYERDRQQRGRSTLQQVILFEADYQLAQLGRLRTLAELLTLNANMKLYGVSYESR